MFFLHVHILNTVSLLTPLAFQSVFQLHHLPWSSFYGSPQEDGAFTRRAFM